MQTLATRKNGGSDAGIAIRKLPASSEVAIPAAAGFVQQALPSGGEGGSGPHYMAAGDATKTVYSPRGKVAALLSAVRADPARVWNMAEVAACMGLTRRRVGGMLNYALLAGALFSIKVGRERFVSGTPFPGREMEKPAPKAYVPRGRVASGWAHQGEDVRIPKVVPGWRPPVMEPPRGAPTGETSCA